MSTQQQQQQQVQPTRRNTTCGLCDERGHNCRTCKSTLLIVALNSAIEYSELCIARTAEEGYLARQSLKNWLYVQDMSVIGGSRRQLMSVLSLRLSLVHNLRADAYAIDCLCGYLFTGRGRERHQTGYTAIPQREILLRNEVFMNVQFQFEMFHAGSEIYTNLRDRYLNSDVLGRRMLVAQINTEFEETTRDNHDGRTRWYHLFLNWVDRRRAHPRIVPRVLFFEEEEEVGVIPALTVHRRAPDATKIDVECVVCYEVKCFCESVVFECNHEMCVSCFDLYVLSVSSVSDMKCAICRHPLVSVSREIGK
jgi:hypothetical protein